MLNNFYSIGGEQHTQHVNKAYIGINNQRTKNYKEIIQQEKGSINLAEVQFC